MAVDSDDLELIASEVVDAADSAGIGLVVTSGERGHRGILFVSRAAERIFGRSRAELLGLAPLKLVSPEEGAHLLTITDEARRNRRMSIEATIVRPDGSRVPISASFTLAPIGDPPASVTFVTDLSERHEALDALRRSEEQFRALIENAKEAIWITGRNGIVFANLAAARLFGFDSAQGTIGKLPRDFLHPADLVMLEKRARAMLRHGERLPPFEYRVRRPDGSWMTAETSSIAIQFEGSPAVLSFGRDVTERKQLEAQMLRADRLATLGMLAGGMAHAINNPLTYVLLNLDQLERMLPTLGRDPAQRADAERLLEQAFSNAERVADLVRRMRAFSRPDEQASVTSVREALDSAIAIVGHELRHRGRLVTELADAPPVVAPPARLEQAFLNLLLHAAQSLPDDGREAEVRIRLGTSDGRVFVEMTHPTGDEHPEPGGEPLQATIGLAICRDLMTQLGGSLEADERGDEVIHRVWLPAAEWTERVVAAPTRE